MIKLTLPLVVCVVASNAHGVQPAVIDGITFVNTGNKLYVPVRDVAKQFGWAAGYDPKTKLTVLNKRKLNPTEIRRGFDGKPLVSIQELARNGVSAQVDQKSHLIELHKKIKPRQMFYVRNGSKRVVVNKKARLLAAWQGHRLVMRTPITYGLEAHQTPNGIFRAQSYRNQAHHSRLYDNFPMPYAVHIVGNIFIHGAKSISAGPGSHGCIRLPMKNAQWMYYWLKSGTPVTIQGKWPRGAA